MVTLPRWLWVGRTAGGLRHATAKPATWRDSILIKGIRCEVVVGTEPLNA